MIDPRRIEKAVGDFVFLCKIFEECINIFWLSDIEFCKVTVLSNLPFYG